MTSGHEIAMGLRAAYWSMHRQTNAHLASLGATAEQFVVLALLVEEDGITQQELGRRATSDPNTIRAVLVLLEKRGLVSRRPHPTDGRAHCVTLTRKGRQAYEKWQARIEPLQNRLRDLFLSDEAAELVGFLHGISESMAELNKRGGSDRPVTSDPAVDG
ncbi:MAG: MarR family transcriptional regulator [Phycisphaerales bacterium]|nr:MAG: MarR family transcriptional regulator [Phycisphaerales bacterium]